MDKTFSLVLTYRRCICEVAAGTTWATSRTNENMCHQHLEPSQSFTASMPAKFNFSQLCRHAGGKDWYDQVPGHFSSLIGTMSQALPAAMSQVHRRHMGTRLFDHVLDKEKDQVSPMFISEHQRKTNVCRFCSLISQIIFFVIPKVCWTVRVFHFLNFESLKRIYVWLFTFRDFRHCLQWYSR